MRTVSVIIPTHNRGEILAETIGSYLDDPSVFELIIIDDGSRDNTMAICQMLAGKDPRVRYYRQENLGAPAARNHGIARASSETSFIFFGEDDAFLEKDTISRLIQCITRYGADIAGGVIIPIDTLYVKRTRSSSDIQDTPVNLNLMRANFKVATREPVEVPFIHALFLAKKWVFDRVKFDENYYGNAYREETDFCIQATKSGAKILYCSDSALFHLEAKQGGQRRINKLSYEMAILKNNWYFLGKHYDYLKKRYHIYTPRWGLQFLLLLRRMYLIFRYYFC